MPVLMNYISKLAFSIESSPRIAIVGCGAITEGYYLPALSHHPSVLQRLILVDPNQARTQQMVKKFNVKTCQSDYRQVLKEVDGAIIAVPIHLHYPITMEFLRKGIPVLCEKPLAESFDKALDLVEQARISQTTLAVNYFQRVIPAFAEVKEILANGTLGEPLLIKYSVCEEFNWPTVSGFYFNSPTSTRGVLRDRGCHVMDHICWWLGSKPRLVSCQNDSFGGSEAVVHIKFESGKCEGEVKLSWLANSLTKFTVVCEKGIIEGDIYDYRGIFLKTNSGRTQRLNLKSKEKSKLDIANKVITNFIKVIKNGEKPLISGSDVLNSIEFIDECYASATRFDMPWYENFEVQSAD